MARRAAALALPGGATIVTGADRSSADREALFTEVYTELRRLATAKAARLGASPTLQATALVHELYLRFERRDVSDWPTRQDFLIAAATAMRDIVVENVRSSRRQKRGGHLQRVSIEVAELEIELPNDDLLALDEALASLQGEHPEHARLVLLRYFAGLGADETAEVLGISPATFRRRWRFAWAWLRRKMAIDDPE
ncbi:MAG: sigma-70 family RNA polymerase sigma factor [Planctomycetes bacterium]|nr:sigma-70 family RNA polymerase sigma factor [Planctomycetota bacterium]